MNRAEASQTNGALSQGPATAEGKAISSQYATKHGLNCRQIVLANESQAEWESYLASYRGTYRPEGACEDDLVNEMAAARWRLRRVVSMERALFDARIANAAKTLEAAGEDPSAALDVAYCSLTEDGKALNNLHRYASRLRREYEKATRELGLIQRNCRNKDEESVDLAFAATPLTAQLQNKPERTSKATAFPAQFDIKAARVFLDSPPPTQLR